MASYSVHMTKMAERDVAEAVGYLLGQGENQAAKELADELDKVIVSLETYPFRAHVPFELKDFPDKSVREISVFGFRPIFRVLDREVFVLFVAHSKRSIEDELIQRAMRFGLWGFNAEE